MATQGNQLAGRLSATLQAVAIQTLISDPTDAGWEALFDPAHHAYSVSRLTRAEKCRFDHARWRIRSTPDLSLAEALALGGHAISTSRLIVPDSAFVSQLLCSGCGSADPVWCLREGLSPSKCPECASARLARSFDLVPGLSAETIPAALLERPLSERGLRDREVFSVGAPGVQPSHFELVDPASADPTRARGRDAVVGGLGNIGSFLVPTLAQMPGIGRVTLADFDSYENANLRSQDFPAAAIGRNKAVVQAERLRALNPDLEVRSFAGRVEALPLGTLRGAIAISCLDSRAARVRLAARAWHAGSPLVDAAVEGGDSQLVRTTVLVPDAANDELRNRPCFECAFSERDYLELEQVFSCQQARVAS